MKKVLDVIEKTVTGLSVVLFVVMVFSIFMQVFLRYALNTGNSWAEEIARYCFVWLVLLGSSVAMRKGRHMRIDYFINLIPLKIRIVVETVLNLGLIIFLLVIVRYGSELAGMTHRQLSTGLEMPMSIPYSAISVGGFLILLFLIESMLIGYKFNFQKLKEGK